MAIYFLQQNFQENSDDKLNSYRAYLALKSPFFSVKKISGIKLKTPKTRRIKEFIDLWNKFCIVDRVLKKQVIPKDATECYRRSVCQRYLQSFQQKDNQCYCLNQFFDKISVHRSTTQELWTKPISELRKLHFLEVTFKTIFWFYLLPFFPRITISYKRKDST